ncbi:MAG: hypothetical protein FJX77_08525, partial [Armatimonadetes bacterium]|nr:hypothetical protein [Armatimonadota bacterium]
MANINLISARRAERVRLSRIARGVMVAIVGTVGAGVIGAAVFAAQILSVKVQIGGADRELARLSPIRKEIEAADKERLVLKPKMDTLNE